MSDAAQRSITDWHWFQPSSSPTSAFTIWSAPCSPSASTPITPIPDVGISNFAGAAQPPDLSHPLPGSHEPCYLTPKPRLSDDGKREIPLYTDQPHLQSMEAIRHVGPYEELPVVHSESHYEQAWKRQTKYRTATFPA